MKKAFPLVCRSCRVKSMIYNTLHFNQYSHGLNIFLFSANNLKTKLKLKKKNFSLVVELVETNPLIYNSLQFHHSKFTPRYSFVKNSVFDQNSKTNFKLEKNFPMVCRARQV